MCDYSFYTSLVESYFYPSYAVPFDEYGLPVQVTNKLRNKINFSDNLDVAIQQLKMVNVNTLGLKDIENDFIRNVQQYI